MTELLTVSIGIGLAVGLVFSEVFGLAPGGMVVCGYIALFLTRPADVALTLVAAVGTFAIVRTASSVLVIYGKRRTAMMILVGYLVGMALGRLVGAESGGLLGEQGIQVIGYIIPGLIATWIDRQGLLETCTAMLTASVIVRLILILFVGQELLA